MIIISSFNYWNRTRKRKEGSVPNQDPNKNKKPPKCVDIRTDPNPVKSKEASNFCNLRKIFVLSTELIRKIRKQ